MHIDDVAAADRVAGQLMILLLFLQAREHKNCCSNVPNAAKAAVFRARTQTHFNMDTVHELPTRPRVNLMDVSRHVDEPGLLSTLRHGRLSRKGKLLNATQSR